jgi:hypothetical protein
LDSAHRKRACKKKKEKKTPGRKIKVTRREGRERKAWQKDKMQSRGRKKNRRKKKSKRCEGSSAANTKTGRQAVRARKNERDTLDNAHAWSLSPKKDIKRGEGDEK